MDWIPDAYFDLYHHLQANVQWYVIGLVVIAIISGILYKFAIPFYLKLLEIGLYCAIMHGVWGTLVRLTSWFKEQTSMEALGNRGEDANPGWTTPYLDFWVKGHYFPEWLFFVEIGFVVAIFALVWRLRPPNFPRKMVASKLGGKKRPGIRRDPNSHMHGSLLSKSMSEQAQGKAIKGKKSGIKWSKKKK